MTDKKQKVTEEPNSIGLEQDIKERLGLVPNFFKTAQSVPSLTPELWRFTKAAYLDLPLPTLFKERLFTHVSRFCELRYCMVRHVGFLLGKGYAAGDKNAKPESVEEVINFLSRPLSNTAESREAIKRLNDVKTIQDIPTPNTALEQDLLDVAALIYVDPRRSDLAATAVKNAFGNDVYELIATFLTFIRAAHYWVETHPGLTYEDDMVEVMAQHPELAKLLLNQKESVIMSSNQSLREALMDLATTQLDLKESQQRFGLAVEVAKMGTWDWDLKTGDLRWSELCSHIMGCEHKEINVIDKFTNCIHPDDRQHVWQCIDQAKSRNALYNPEFRIISEEDGSVRWVHTVGRFIFTEDSDEPARMVGLIMDINERKHAEQALRKSEEFKRRIIESSEDCIKVLDLEGNILSMNQSGAAILEIDDVGPYLHKNWASFWKEEDQPSAYAAIKDALNGKIGRFEGCLNSMKTNTPKWWSVIITPMMDGSRPAQLLAVSRDVTERKLHEQDLEKAMKHAELANRTKSEFLANMSHEIRTPMNAVVGLSNILSISPNIPAKEKEYIATLQSSASHLMTLINNMLDISKIESSVVELEEISLNPSDIVHECLKLIEADAAEKNINIKYNQNFSEQIDFLGDPLRIKQIVMNLLSNAIKFTEKGSIEVTLSYDFNVIKFSVKDSGIGMTEEVCSKVFDKFTQADASTTRKYGGTGLGLAISKQLAELMQGSLTVKSETGKGTEFTLSLSLKPVRSNIQKLEPATPALNIPNKEVKILLVEDYEANILVASTMLSNIGIECDIAKSGNEAIAKFNSNKFDLILMDVQMPDMDGYETTKMIRFTEQNQNLALTPIIAMTANAMLGDKEKCLEAGMDDYISKPFNLDDLQEKIIRYTSSNNQNELVA